MLPHEEKSTKGQEARCEEMVLYPKTGRRRRRRRKEFTKRCARISSQSGVKIKNNAEKCLPPTGIT
ncbi:Hypothetical protein FKW44_019446 [Caligus rogercresseyi]|uniref:Uncharacterized protein n=1 Tax=Caligus rogercresseyi TaxID=217165 RepID=A0A7T8JY58_CALRO|nr:Hypothetical protein FKW44_019446 [Caligus rogercresseyi]